MQSRPPPDLSDLHVSASTRMHSIHYPSSCSQCVDALKDLLTGKDWGSVAAALHAAVPLPKKGMHLQ